MKVPIVPSSWEFFVGVVCWVFGYALATGFWSSLLAAVFPPWAWVQCAEFVIERWLR